ncbi:unnamed protein product [Malus baccata var. baccata]
MSLPPYSPLHLSSEEEEEPQEGMADNRTLRELATPNTDQQPLCITYPNADGGFELKSGMIHYLPKFHGFSTEDANKHLMEFHVVCSGMRPANVDEEQVKLRAFPFTLEAKANEWLYNLPPGSMNTWNQVKQAFLEQYFLATKATSIMKDICAIRQQHGEPFGDYYKRFTHLVASCPNHQISEHILIQYFYEGLCVTDRVMLDAASGGAFMDKTPTNAKALLKNITGNTRQFGGRDELPLKKVNEVMVAPKQVCGVCSMMGHATEMCPSLMDQGGIEQANALGGFQGQQRQRYDPYSNNYNAGWPDHPHLKWNNQDNGQQSVPNNYNRPPGFFQARPHAPFQPQQQQAPSKSLEDLIASLANFTQSHQQKTDKAIENLERQISQLASLMGQQHQPRRLLSQTVVNPNAEQMNVVTLRSGKEVFEQAMMQKRTRKDTIEQGKLQTKNLEQDEASTEAEKSLKRKLPPKLKDAGSFTIPCVVGGKEFGRALCDLGVSINLMPYSVYESLNLGDLKETKVIIQLADRSNRYPKGLLEDVLVQVNELIFPADFFVLEMEHDPMPIVLPLILGRPFLRTARMKIDVYDGTLTMEIDGESVKFRIFNAMRIVLMKAPKLELKLISEFLKYTFLGEDETLPVIISSQLTTEEGDKLIRLLWRIKKRRLSHVHLAHLHTGGCRLDFAMLPPHFKGVWFMKDFSMISRPLCRLLQKDVTFDMNEECVVAFNKLKELLSTAHVIIPPNWSLPFELMCDASNYVVGAVLGQRVNKVPHVVYYASRTLNDAQLNYSTTEKELLAVVFALEKFRSYLIGTKVIELFDHAALKYQLTKKMQNRDSFDGYFCFKSLTWRSRIRKGVRML